MVPVRDPMQKTTYYKPTRAHDTTFDGFRATSPGAGHEAPSPLPVKNEKAYLMVCLVKVGLSDRVTPDKIKEVMLEGAAGMISAKPSG